MTSLSVSEIVEQTDIVEYISQFCDLEERADGEHWGLSPLKEEETPSFSVNPDKQLFYDFSSGKGGNILDFICLYNDCGIKSGVSILKDFAGLTGENNKSGRLLATSVAKRYNRKERELKKSTGIILPKTHMEGFSWDIKELQPWLNEGVSVEALLKYQVRYDKNANRIVFPIHSPTGDIINVCGRTLDKDYKSKKLRKYTYYKPLGTLDTIYGLYENYESIMSTKEMILFEGAKSVMLADDFGYSNVGAILTSHLNHNQFKLLIKLGVRVVFALDAEVDVRQDEKIMKLLPYCDVWWVRNFDNLLDDKDSPVDKGKEVFDLLYEKRKRILR